MWGTPGGGRTAGETRGRGAWLRRLRRTAPATGQRTGREIDRTTPDRHVRARLVRRDRLLHRGPHRRDLARRIQLEGEDVVIVLQAPEGPSDLLLALQRCQLARRQRALTRPGGELFQLRGTNTHGA